MKLIILLALLLSACAPLFTPDCPDCIHTQYEDTEAYYRGVYTFCMVMNAKAAENGATRFVDCAEMVKIAYSLKWHERDAHGFEWPPGEDLSSLNDTAMNYVK